MRTLRNIKAEGRDSATPAEQAVISKFVGWGQFPAVFNNYYDRLDENLSGEAQEAIRNESRNWNKERELLKSMLSDEEWDTARASTLNAHYTHPDVVRAHWLMAQRLGFDGGRFLETSAGIGYYLGLMPEELAAKTRSSAVEKDKGTGDLLKMLYPSANVNIQGFEEHQSPDNFFDLVASNVPFGAYGVHDPRYNKHKANIHDYFFLKSLDKVRAGGLVMHITSKGTLDKGDSKIREELAKKGELVAAIRFPGGAHKENAGTEVVTDLLIIRKKHPGEQPVDPNVTPPEAAPKKPGFTGITVDSLGRLYHWVNGKRVPGPDWTSTTTVPDPAGGEPIPINSYFAAHPEQVLGTVDRTGTMYRGESVNVSPTEDYEERLAEAINRLPAGIMKKDAAPASRFSPDVMPAPGDTKEGGYVVQGGKVFVRESGMLVEQPGVNAKDLARIEGQLGIRDAMRAVLNDQLEGRDATESRRGLNELYDAYVAKHGFLNLQANRRAMKTDPDSFRLMALEDFNPETKKATKTAIFEKDVAGYVPKAEKASGVSEALGVSLHEHGGVNLERMAQLLGWTPEEVGRAAVIAGVAFQDPQEGWKPADQYLSGNVRRKLTLAKAAAAADSRYNANVEALLKVQPEDVPHEEIGAKLGVPWVPPADVKAFAAMMLAGEAHHFDIKYSPATATWFADYTNSGERNVENTDQAKAVWGVPKANFMELLKHALNNQAITIYDQDADGKSYVVRDATEDANAKIQDIKAAFKDWLWEDDERRQRLHRHYNDNFNNIRPIQYDGSHQTFPGMNPACKLRPHQKNFVWQVVTTGKGLAAHEVGTGKTYSMVAAAMEQRRLGLARKPAIVCLKANIETVVREAQELYPGAKIISTADMFDAKSRKETIARIATGDYDMVFMTHDNMNMLPMRPAVVQKYIKEEMAELEEAIVAAIKDDPSADNKVVKQLEKAKQKLEVALKKALATETKDDAVFFEELGIDSLFIDEFHKFKSLPTATKQYRIKGIPNARSQRATNMLMRARWLQENNGGRGLVGLTGTPVANTMAELYNMQKYIQPEELKERGVYNFDAWASTFGDVVTKPEFTITGEFKPISRFAEFTNIPELMQISRQMMDVQRADDMTQGYDEVPKTARPTTPDFTGTTKDKDGKEYQWTSGRTPIIVRPKRLDSVNVAPRTEAMDRLMKSLASRAAALKGKRPGDDDTDNMLVICTDGRKGSLDMRMLDANAPDDPNSKTNLAIKNVLDTHKEKPGMAQLIFCDLGVHPGKAKAEGAEEEEGDESEGDTGGVKSEIDSLSGSNTGFHLYGDIIQKLVKGGIPREKIADFSQLKGEKKEAAMAAMRRGDILIGLGSTDKLGTGVNVQDRLAALHHLDVPWMPASVEQRDGRGHRQGNLNKEVQIHRYVSEGSADSTFWQIIANKARFIKQSVASANPSRHAREEDTEELSPEQLMAATSGDPRIMEKVNLDEDVKTLGRAKLRHEREQVRLRDTVRTGERNIPHLERRAASLRKDAETMKSRPDFEMEVGDKTYTNRKEADEALKTWVQTHAEDITNSYRSVRVGTYRGMELMAGSNGLHLRGSDGEKYFTGNSLPSIEYPARQLAKNADEADDHVARTRADIERTKGNIGKTFAQAQELEQKSARAKELTAALQAESRANQGEGEGGEGASSPDVAKAEPVRSKLGDWTGNVAAHKVKPPTLDQLWKGARDFRKEQYIKTAHDGYLTDGSFMMAISDEDKAVLPPAPDYSSSLKPRIEELLAKPSGAPAKVVASKKDGRDVHRLIEDGEGNRAAIDGKYLAMIEKSHPGAVLHFGVNDNGKVDPEMPLTAKVGDKPVARVGPLRDSDTAAWKGSAPAPTQHRRPSLSLQFSRLSAAAARSGDRWSSVIYARQAREAEQRDLAVQYQRLSHAALRDGDRASSLIYARQASDVLRYEWTPEDEKKHPRGKGGKFTAGT